MSKMLFIFEEFDRPLVEGKDRIEAQDEIETVFGSFMEDFYETYSVHFCNQETTIFGFENPEEIIKIAETWNRDLRDTFTTQYKAYMNCWGANISSASCDGLDNLDTFRLRMAVSALDNHFTPVADQFAFASKDRIAFTVLTDEDIAYIRENPEMCAIVYLSCC